MFFQPFRSQIFDYHLVVFTVIKFSTACLSLLNVSTMETSFLVALSVYTRIAPSS